MEEVKRILLIDDEVDLVEAVAFQIKAKKGYDTYIAHNGAEGLKKLDEIRPDLIVLDMNMPVMGGIEFYSRISDSGKNPKYPVLVLTARANLEELFNNLDVSGFMTKPFDLEVLLKEIETIVSGKKPEDSVKKLKELKRAKKILFVEDDDEAFKNIAVEFLNKGYMVNAARNGGAALEKIMVDIPDLILIKMGLKDLTGDLVAEKFKKMPKITNIPMVIYAHEDDERLNFVVANKICEKIGISHLVSSKNPRTLLEEVMRLIDE